jgi:hypothetical protein
VSVEKFILDNQSLGVEGTVSAFSESLLQLYAKVGKFQRETSIETFAGHEMLKDTVDHAKLKEMSELPHTYVPRSKMLITDRLALFDLFGQKLVMKYLTNQPLQPRLLSAKEIEEAQQQAGPPVISGNSKNSVQDDESLLASPQAAST